jgi:flavin-dependent dehydrogenase
MHEEQQLSSRQRPTVADLPSRQPVNERRIETDVAIVGAGPGGSSLAGFLRLLGVRVTVFEKDVFPRFHVGESLLTMSIPALLELGIDLDRAPFALKKPGALFRDERSGESIRIDFAHALEGTFPFAYQVERGPFDHALALRAEELGADVRFGTEVLDVREDEAGVELTGPFGSCRARFVVDASGQEALVGRKRRSLRQLERFGRCASFSTYGNVQSELARSIVGGGDIGVILSPHGWLWLIPLPRERVSVGLVERTPRAGTTAEETLTSCISGSAFLSRVFAGAECIAPFRRIANYSYYNVEPSTERVVSLGDARAFLDPIFSSGVTIAVLSARLLAREIARVLREGTALELTDYWARCEVAYTTFDRLIERFYRPEWVHNVLFAAGRETRLVREFTAILAGDVWRGDNSVQEMLLKSRPRTGLGSDSRG